MRGWLGPGRSPLLPTLVALAVVFGGVGLTAALFLGTRGAVMSHVGAELAGELGLEAAGGPWYRGAVGDRPYALAQVLVRNPRAGVGDRVPDVVAVRIVVPVEADLGVHLLARGRGEPVLDGIFQRADHADRLDAAQRDALARFVGAHGADGSLRVAERRHLGDLVADTVLPDAPTLLVHERMGLDARADDVRAVVSALDRLAAALEGAGGAR